jgi:hypothetical protein
MIANKNEIKYETEIIWYENPLEFNFLREKFGIAKAHGKISKTVKGGKVVGYANLSKDCPTDNGYCDRRFFVYYDGDDSLESIPSEAVIPESVSAGIPSTPFSGANLAE